MVDVVDNEDSIEDNLDVVEDDVIDHGDASADSTLSPEEEEAYAMGWRPESEFKGDPKKWTSAKEFIARQSLFDKIHEKNAEIDALKQGQAAVMEMLKSQYESGYKAAKEELEAIRAAALDDNNLTDYVEADKKLAKLEADHKKKTAELEKGNVKGESKAPAVQVPEEFTKWADDNIWYAENEVLASYADTVAKSIKEEYANDLEGLLKEVTRRVSLKYPKSRYFSNSKRQSAASVESGNKMSGSKDQKYTRAQLNATEIRVMESMMKTMPKGKDGKPLVSEEDYIKQVVAKRK